MCSPAMRRSAASRPRSRWRPPRLHRARAPRCQRPAQEPATPPPSDVAEADAPEVGWFWDASTRAVRRKLEASKSRPKRALGQNFVTNKPILEKLVREAGIGSGDLVLEVGPGTGNLTAYLLQAGATVLALEKDVALADELPAAFRDAASRLRVIEGDVLRADVAALARELKQMVPNPPAKVKMVANLPYYITTDALKRLLPMGEVLSDIAFMVQDEVAQRLTDVHPGSRAYRPMTVFCHYYSVPRYKMRVHKSCYFPAPQVDGALVHFRLLPPGERVAVAREADMLRFVNQAFNSKRKQLANALRPLWQREHVERALRSLEFDPQARAEDVPANRFFDLYNAVTAIEEGKEESQGVDVQQA